MLSATFDDRGGGANDPPFPWTSPAPRPFSAALKFYKFYVEIAIALRVILIPVFHYGSQGDPDLSFPYLDFRESLHHQRPGDRTTSNLHRDR